MNAKTFLKPRRDCRLVSIGFLVAASTAMAAVDSADGGPAPATSDGSSGFHFSLLPTAFQKNPVMPMTVVTEFTEFGRTQPKSSPEHPIYFVARPSGLHSRGESVAGEKAPPASRLADVLNRALAKNGFLPADSVEGTKVQPGLVLVYYWGSHHRIDPTLLNDLIYRDMYLEQDRRDKIERARLVAGTAFAAEYAREIDAGPKIGVDAKKDFFVDQLSGDLYYVVVSAYAFDEVARNHQKLVWRTTMTVGSEGSSMADTLLPLLAAASTYFGRETAAVPFERRIINDDVKIGPLRKVEDEKSVSGSP